MIGKRKRIRQQLQKTSGRGSDYFASCYGKIRYTKDQAKDRADGLSTMKWYKCRYSNDGVSHYHVGRKPGTIKP